MTGPQKPSRVVEPFLDAGDALRRAMVLRVTGAASNVRTSKKATGKNAAGTVSYSHFVHYDAPQTKRS